jgi:hypothetical protein
MVKNTLFLPKAGCMSDLPELSFPCLSLFNTHPNCLKSDEMVTVMRVYKNQLGEFGSMSAVTRTLYEKGVELE